MPRTSTIQARIDPEIKSEAQKILSQLNISLSEAISMYLTQITLHRGIPFEIKIPNELTHKTMKKLEKGKEIHQTDSSDELFRELDL